MQNGIVEANTHRPLNPKEFRAFTLIDDYAPLIFINTKDTRNSQIFSLLHELVHISIGRPSIYNDVNNGSASKYTNTVEIFCNAVAAEILSPNKQFKDVWAATHENNLELKVDTIAEKQRTAEKRKSGGDPILNAQSRYDYQFIQALSNEIKTGAIPYSNVKELTGLNKFTFNYLISCVNKT